MASLLGSLADRTPRETTTVSAEESAAVAVCRAVGHAMDEDVLDLPPLGDVASVEALEGVVTPAQASGHLAFRYLEFAVVVYADGTIEVYEAG